MILTRMRLRVNRSKISGPALVAPQPDLLARAFSAALGVATLRAGGVHIAASDEKIILSSALSSHVHSTRPRLTEVFLASVLQS